MKRPPTVWLTQSLLLVFAVLFLLSLLINLASLLSHLEDEFSFVRIVLVYSVILSIVLVFGIAFWGLARRKMYGRWLGLLSLIFLWGLFILITLRRPSGPYKYYEYDNPAQLAGAVFFQVVLHGLFLMLILRLSFSKKIRQFFPESQVASNRGAEAS